MKVLVLGSQKRYEQYLPKADITKEVEVVYLPMNTEVERILEAAGDAQCLIADAIAKVDESLIQGMSQLKMIMSEGVGYNGIDVEAATKRGIPVCNNKGINSVAVAEQTLLFMLALLRDFIPGDRAVREGHQIQKKERMMVEGFLELSECTIGLVGFGDIGREVTKLLKPFGCTILYHEINPLSSEQEEEWGVAYRTLNDLLAQCNMVSLHLPATKATHEMVNEDFLKKMRKDAWLINTARGELVDNAALRRALEEGWICGAALDTVAPEPTMKDNIMVDLPESVRDRVLYSPHIAGVSTGTFRRGHKNIWENIRRVRDGEDLLNVVNRI